MDFLFELYLDLALSLLILQFFEAVNFLKNDFVS